MMMMTMMMTCCIRSNNRNTVAFEETTIENTSRQAIAKAANSWSFRIGLGIKSANVRPSCGRVAALRTLRSKTFPAVKQSTFLNSRKSLAAQTRCLKAFAALREAREIKWAIVMHCCYIWICKVSSVSCVASWDWPRMEHVAALQHRTLHLGATLLTKTFQKGFPINFFEATTPSGNPSKSKQQILLRFSPLYCFLMSLIHTAAMFWFKIAATSCEAKMYRHSMDFCEIWNTQSCAKEHHWHCRSEGSS